MRVSIAEVEQVAYRAWPARETVRYDGWVLRYGDGFSRRINSVAAVEASTRPFDEKLAYCRRWYAERGLPLRFRIVPTAAGITTALEERGFRAEGHTVVMVLPAVRAIGPRADVWIGEAPTGPWIAAELDLAGVARDQAAAWLTVLKRLPEPAGFALLMSAGAPVAAGIGVVVGSWLGVFEVVVDPAKRRRGYGRALMEALHAWAFERGAGPSFLQVVVENKAAIGLYESLGYQEAYRYRYLRSAK